MWSDFLKRSCADNKGVVKHKGMWRTSRGCDGRTGFQLIVADPSLIFTERICGPCRLTMADVFSINVPHHGGKARHAVPSTVHQVGRHGGWLKNTNRQSRDIDGGRHTGLDRDVVIAAQSVVFCNDFNQSSRPRVEQTVIGHGSIACRP